MNTSEYGKIRVKQTKGGIVEVYDDTPGNITKFSLHPSGTYDAMNDNGDRVQKTEHDKIEVTNGTWQVSVYGDRVQVVSGETRIELRSNKLESIAGDSDLTVIGEKRSVVYGDVTDNFEGNLFQKVTLNKLESITGNSSSNVTGTLTETNKGHQETVVGNLSIHVSGNVSVLAGGNATIGATGITRILGSKILIG